MNKLMMMIGFLAGVLTAAVAGTSGPFVLAAGVRRWWAGEV